MTTPTQLRRGSDTLHIPFRATYPPGHEIAGVAIERGRECGCGRWFTQHVVNPGWLDSLGSEERKESFLESCEVERRADDTKEVVAHHPQRCHRCTRRQL